MNTEGRAADDTPFRLCSSREGTQDSSSPTTSCGSPSKSPSSLGKPSGASLSSHQVFSVPHLELHGSLAGQVRLVARKRDDDVGAGLPL